MRASPRSSTPHPLVSLLSAAIVSARLLLTPLTAHARFHDSLEYNDLTNGGEDMSGIIQLAEALKTNEGLTSLKYARPPPTFPIWQVSAATVSACILLTP